MAYCTLADLMEELPADVLMRLTDDAGAGEIDAGKAQRAIDTAAGEIDTYLGARYALPLSSVPPVLGKFNADIAIYNLYSRVRETVPEMRQKRYDNAVRFLERVAEGKISLGLQPPPKPPAAGHFEKASRVESREKVFGPDTMAKY